MMEPTTRLDVARNMGVKALSLGCDPIYNGAFHSFCVVSTGTISTLLNLMGIVNTDFTGEVSRSVLLDDLTRRSRDAGD